MDLIPFFSREFDENCMYKIQESPDEYMLGSSIGLDRSFLGYALTRLLIQQALISIVTQSLHLILRRFNVPRISSEILAGILLGKTVLRRIIGETQNQLFPTDDAILDTLRKLGFILFMFLVGVKMDPGLIWKAGSKGWTIGLASTVIPAAVFFFMGKKYDNALPLYHRPSIKVISGILTIIPFPVIVALLIDLKIMNTELGRLCLASTLISDLTTTCYAALMTNWRSAFLGGSVMIFVQSTYLDLILVGSIIVTRPLFLSIIKSTPQGKPVNSIYIMLLCAWVFASAIISETIGLPYQWAPFFIGLTVPDGPPLGATITSKLDTFVLGLLTPLLLTYSALNIDALVVYDFNFLGFVVVVIILIVAFKFVVITSVALLKGVPLKEAITLAFILGAQGIVQAALYDRNFHIQIVDDVTFSALILSIFTIITFTHFIVKSLNDYSRIYTGYQKRSIVHTANSELRVVICIHRQDDAMAALKLLEASNPSRECPLSLYAIHLVELMGRTTPIFINHSLGQKNKSGGSCSQQVIDLLECFERQHTGSATVQIFTAMSLPVFMNQDICSLAFDKSAALIVLPFHRKWNQHGKVVYDSNIVRTINQRVVELSPCSVGIYVDRRKIRQKTDESPALPASQQYQVAIIYLGGSDDREALAYGKRMMRSMAIHVTIIRLVPTDDDPSETQWDKVLDSEALREMKLQSTQQGNVTYQEENVTDGPETATLMKSVVDAFDLMLVGHVIERIHGHCLVYGNGQSCQSLVH